jgi:leucyl aminopeptidase
MNAEQFYKNKIKDFSHMLHLLAPQDLTSQHAALSGQGFLGELGNVAFTYENNITQVYIGAGVATADQAIAYAMSKLPAGCYTVATELSYDALLMWSVAQYGFDRYKPSKIALRVLCTTHADLNNVLITASSIFLIRDLINTPTNDMCPKALADVVADLAQTYNANWGESVGDDLLNENFPAIHAVGRASASEPRLLSLTWGHEKHPCVALVGKGVCFDSGGLDLKTASTMRLMKKDMGGAAQAIGLAKWIMAMQLPIRLELLIPAVENSVDGLAYRPGDVLIMRNGLSVEIDNTDAEGRLVLADALVYACEKKPDLIIDFATLTGAARVAVGTEISAAFSNNDDIIEKIIQCGEKVQDPIWRMPLYAGYARLLDSTIADMVNSSPLSYAGAITAALFLQRFVEEGIPWVHFDVMAWNLSSRPGKPEGGEAMAMLAVAQYLIQRYPLASK